MIIKMMASIQGLKLNPRYNAVSDEMLCPLDLNKSNELGRPYLKINESKFLKRTIERIASAAGIEKFVVSLKNDSHIWHKDLNQLDVFIEIKTDEVVDSDSMAKAIGPLVKNYFGHKQFNYDFLIAISVDSETLAPPSWLSYDSNIDFWGLYLLEGEKRPGFKQSAYRSAPALFEFSSSAARKYARCLDESFSVRSNTEPKINVVREEIRIDAKTANNQN